MHLDRDIATHERSAAEFTEAEKTEEGEQVHAPITSAGESIMVGVAVALEKRQVG
jgi:hypothetical protein